MLEGGEAGVERFVNRPLRLLRRIVVLVLGLALLLVGIVMIVTPGPAFLLIPAALALLATEFDWARNILHRARPLFEKAVDNARHWKERHGAAGTDAQQTASPVAAPPAPLPTTDDARPPDDARGS
jgi:uncharacterized protein (TIGR02611 family)